MSLAGFDQLAHEADGRRGPVAVAAAGGDEPSVLEALGAARDRGWITPVVVGANRSIREAAEAAGVGLEGFRLVEAGEDAVAKAAVAEVRAGRAGLLMKGRIATPALLRAVLDGSDGLRTGRVVCQ